MVELFSLAVINKDYKTVFRMIEFIKGTPKQTVESKVTAMPQPLAPVRESDLEETQ